MPELTDRQLQLLSALIRAYTLNPEPVSSKQLVEETDLGVSSATIRNELAVLEQLGMIRSPHTSAGRVPTEEGYRYFVQHLIHENDLPSSDQQMIRSEVEHSVQDIQKLVRTVANVLARQTQAAALVTEPRARAPRFRHLQLISTQGRLVLLVMVLEGGEVMQQLLTLTEPVDQERLTQTSLTINAKFNGETAAGIRQKLRTLSDVLAQEVLELVADVLSEASMERAWLLHGYGFGDVLPQFEESIGAQQALRALEGNQVMSRVLTETVESTDEDPVRVLIGGEGDFEDISHLGIVVGRYGTGKLVGAISVLGPTRMRYGRAISTVRYLSTLMSTMLKDVFGSEE